MIRISENHQLDYAIHCIEMMRSFKFLCSRFKLVRIQMHGAASFDFLSNHSGFLAWSPYKTNEENKKKIKRGKINNYYKLLTGLINSNYTRDRSSFKSLSLRSLCCTYLCLCLCVFVCENEILHCMTSVRTGACVNMSVV